jgi:hypothetical protein
MNLLRIACLTIILAALNAGAADSKNWISLFNGKDLEGWKHEGTGIFKVEDGCLIGTQTDGKGGNLYTTREFDNFECRFTYKVKWPANSGIWFRDKYQYDILKHPKPAFSGTIYCPGKLFITTNLDESLENRDGWNEGRIFANGDHLAVWLNGKKTGDCHDSTVAKGRIGIQVHPGEGMKNMQIIIKRIEVRPLAADETPED